MVVSHKLNQLLRAKLFQKQNRKNPLSFYNKNLYLMWNVGVLKRVLRVPTGHKMPVNVWSWENVIKRGRLCSIIHQSILMPLWQRVINYGTVDNDATIQKKGVYFCVLTREGLQDTRRAKQAAEQY